MLLNLATNAVKFTEAGAVRLAISWVGEQRLRFEVEDSGPGIAQADLPRLFEPFTQGDASTARLHGGSGLGLAISKRLVERMGGALQVDSALGRGSRFTFTLPLEAAPAAASAEPAPPAPAAQTVLLVEDHLVNQLVATRLLERLGHRVTAVAGGLEALDFLAERPVDLVLMDVQMPGMDGLETTRRLRTAGFEAPILALTADASEEARAQCLAAGMNDHLSKPVTLQSLGAAVDRWATAPA